MDDLKRTLHRPGFAQSWGWVLSIWSLHQHPASKSCLHTLPSPRPSRSSPAGERRQGRRTDLVDDLESELHTRPRHHLRQRPSQRVPQADSPLSIPLRSLRIQPNGPQGHPSCPSVSPFRERGEHTVCGCLDGRGRRCLLRWWADGDLAWSTLGPRRGAAPRPPDPKSRRTPRLSASSLSTGGDQERESDFSDWDEP